MPKPRKAATSEAAPPADASCMIVVRVVPRSSKIVIQAEGEASYKIKLTAPAIEGRANDQLIEVLSEKLKISRSRLQIVSGAQARRKRIRILGMTSERVSSILSEPE